jgi:hypothetical protein
MLITALLWLYRHSLQILPTRFRAEFAEEMITVFQEMLAAQAEQGAPAVLRSGLREFGCLPLVLWRVHRREHSGRWSQPLAALRSPFHPVPPDHDGRDSWLQTLLECGPLLIAGGLLLAITYAQPLWPGNFPQVTMMDAAAWLGYGALALFLLGLWRRLPRWSYPAAGLWWGSLLFTASALVQFWAGALLAFYCLVLLAAYTHRRRGPLAPALQQLGHSLALDWTRVSLAFYALLPYAIAAAFDDARADNRTVCLALAVPAMVAGAVVYCRSRDQRQALAVLAVGVTVTLGMAALDEMWLQGSLRVGDALWLGQLASGLLALLLLPLPGSVLHRSWQAAAQAPGG